MSVFGSAVAVVGHRGAPREAPENTPAAFRAAALAGATWVELDVRRSRDGVPVVVHDARGADGVPVVAQDAAALAARGVPDLAQVLADLPAGLGVDVEVKNLPGEPDADDGQRVVGSTAEILAAEVGRRPLVTSSFNPATATALAAALPAVPAGLVTGEGTSLGMGLRVVAELGLPLLCIAVGARGLDAAGFAAARAAGRSVLVWTVDDPLRACELAAAGAAALCTNEPRAVAAALRGAERSGT